MKRLVSAITLSLAFSMPAVAAIPDWMRTAARSPFTPGEKDLKGVVLLSDEKLSVDEKGDLHRTVRRVTRILGSGGRELGAATAAFSNNSRIVSMRAWSIGSDGKEYEVKERDAVELALFDVELYSDHRVRTLTIPAASPGAVVGYEITTRERPYGLQDLWSPQSTIPVVRASYEISTPAGWKFVSDWTNQKRGDPVVNGTIVRWTLENLAAIEDEVGMPNPAAFADAMRIQLFPPTSHTASDRALDSWDAIAAWYGALAESRSSSTPSTTARATELAKGRSTIAEKIEAIAAHTQRDTRYVAIAIGIGGYQPHAADEVLKSGFGDCKDKVTLLRAMLRAIGVETLYALAHTERGVVKVEAPSLRAFNHVIAAIRLPSDLKLDHPSIFNHSKLGRLLFFDPTDEATPLGELPEYLQDSDVLVVNGERGEMFHLPAPPPATSKLHVAGEFELDPSGTLTGTVRETRTGWIAARMRSYMRSLNDAERVKYVDDRIANWLHGAEISDLRFENVSPSRSELVISYKIIADAYARSAGNLLLIRPRVIGRKADFLFDLDKRRVGYELDAPSLETDEIVIRMPAGSSPDEVPAKVSFNAPGFRYESETLASGGALRYKRKLEVSKRSIPVEQLKELRSGFEKVHSDEKSMAIFK